MTKQEPHNAVRDSTDGTQADESSLRRDFAAAPIKPEGKLPVTPKRHHGGQTRLARQVSHECLSGVEESESTLKGVDKDRSSPVQPLADLPSRQCITLPDITIKTSHNLAECRSPRNGVPPMFNPLRIERFLSLHLKALQLEAALHPLKQILHRLMSHASWNKKGIFNSPVDPVAMQAPAYFEVIHHPMDLGTVKRKLHAMVYESLNEAVDDIRLCFRNAMIYNPPTNLVHANAANLLQFFETQLQSCGLPTSQTKQTSADGGYLPWINEQSFSKQSTHSFAESGKRKSCRRNGCPSCLGQTCYMCGEGCLPLEHSLLICHGNYCFGARIRKGAPYYVAPDGHLLYCQRCYMVLPSALAEVEKDAKSSCRYKSELLKRKNDEEVVERWIRCVTCNKAAHHVCALFNPFVHDSSEYECSSCSKIARDPDHSDESQCCGDDYTFVAGSDKPVLSSSIDSSNPASQRARGLPRSPIADFMELKIRALLSGQNNNTEKTVSVRLISNTERDFHVPRIIQRFFETSQRLHVQANEPISKVCYESKAIALFQTIDGLDVCLFCMYVHEYDGTKGEAEDKRVYIAYLDSVEYFRPSSLRTQVYQEMIISYLATAKKRGYTNAHIWACPPIRGNSFIFWQHPAEQRTPNMDRLTDWYNATLSRAMTVGIVSDVVSLYESDFEKTMDEICSENDNQSLHKKMPCPPLLDGDFWIEEAQRVYQTTSHKYSRELLSVSNPPTLFSIDKSLCPALQLASMLKNQIIGHPSSQAFRRPVNAATLKIRNYHDIIEHPMDLSTVYTKLSLGEYEQLGDFVDEMELIFANAMKFNPPSNLVHQKAIEVRNIFFQELDSITRLWCAGQRTDHSWRAFSESSLLLCDQVDNKMNTTPPENQGSKNETSERSVWMKMHRSDGPSSVYRRMVGKDVDIFEQKQTNSSKKQKRKDFFPLSHQESRATKRRRQTWLGEEVGKSVRRMRTSFFNCSLQGSDGPSEPFELYSIQFAGNRDEFTCRSRIADSRHGFLEFSQMRNIEFDTLRKAKYSTAIILYHLYNDEAPGVCAVCTNCLRDIEKVRWHFLGRISGKNGLSNVGSNDVCSDCYAKCQNKNLYTPIPISI